MRRANPRQIGRLCQVCSSASSRATYESLPARLIRPQSVQATRYQAARAIGHRWMATASIPAQTEDLSTVKTSAQTPVTPVKQPAELVTDVESSYKNFTSEVEQAPNSQLTKSVLEDCLRAAIALHPRLKQAKTQWEASSSRLALLNAERTGAGFAMEAELHEARNRISQAAYKVVNHRNVEMTPEVLEFYVHIQSHLGRPESLPVVLELFARKYKPVVKNGVVEYVPQNPDAPVKAVDKQVGDLALQTAIDAKNLDAALGITEVAFCTKAFKRQKLLKHATVPAMGLAGLPFGIFGLGSAYALYWQNTMDIATATGLGVAGISGYFFVTGSLGMIAKLSHKDQMKRVTWLPGTPLRYRWMREEEREALDKIACAWGYKESWRHGEETGADWEGLREYMGYRQMILDRVEFMEGMN